jgi:Tol biopolymer transport system component
LDGSQDNKGAAFARGPQEGRLDSWKKIASYLKRDVTTAQRWERREGLPVHRHVHDKLGSVYAFRSELDTWWASRGATITREGGDPASAPSAAESATGSTTGPDAAPKSPPLPRSVRLRRWLALALSSTLIAAAFIGFRLLERADYFWRNPLDGAKFQPLTDFDGNRSSAAISRDGTTIAFLADRDGPMDVWATRIGSGNLVNLTRGRLHELVNPLVRGVAFSPDAAVVSIWSRQPDGTRPGDIGLWAVPVTGGEFRPYLPGAAEYDWSSDGRVVYHTTGPGDPLFVGEPGRTNARKLYVAPSGVHCHFPIWSPDNTFVYFIRGVPPDDWDIWRIRADGEATEQITSLHARVTHPVFLDRRTLLYLAADHDGSGPWLYSLDVRRRTIHRLTTGIERYTSLSAGAAASRLVVTVATSKSTLWRVRISDRPIAVSSPAPLVRPESRASSPRFGGSSIYYVNAEGDRRGLWRLHNGTTSVVWNDARARMISAPAIAANERQIAFVAETNGRKRLIVIRSDGTDHKEFGDGLDLDGSPAWTRDGQALVIAIRDNGTPRIFRFPLDGEPPVLLISEYSVNPVWSPDGEFLVYSGPDIGTSFPLRAAAADGRAHALPSIMLTRGARRIGFLAGSHSLVVLRGEIASKNFWLIDLDTGAERQLTQLPRDFVVGDFDISSDGTELVFDRAEENSDLVLIERARS